MPHPRAPQRHWRTSLACASAAALVFIAIRGVTPASAAVVAELPHARHRITDSVVVTFARDVAPIIQKNCQLCHSPGGIGPMPLLTYAHTRRYAPLIKQLVEAREMPPYQYDTHVGIQKLQHDWRLSDGDIATVASDIQVVKTIPLRVSDKHPCPRCRTELVSEKLYDTGPHVFRCRDCSGVLVPSAVLDEVVALGPSEERGDAVDSGPLARILTKLRKVFGATSA